MKIAVTGSSGFVGGELVRQLESNGHEVVRVSRRDGVSITDVDALTRVFTGCDAVAHCAGINREIGDQTYQAVHIDGTANVCAAAKTAGVGKITLVSFLRARPNCGSAYHESKYAAEQIVRNSGINYTVIKAGVIYGRGDHMLDHLSHAFYTFPVFGLVGFQDKPMRPNAVADVAGILHCALVDGRLQNATVPVVGPEELTLEQAVRRVAGVVGRRPLFFRLPVWFHYVLGWCTERVMKVPLVAIAQVRILSEGLVEPTGQWEPLPKDLAPTTPFTNEHIAAGLPRPGRFTRKDLRCHKSDSLSDAGASIS